MTGENWHFDKLKKAVIYTHNLFLQEIAHSQIALKDYLEYLEKKGKGYSLPEAQYFPSRTLLTEWNSSTKPFLKLIEKIHCKNNFFKPLQLDLSFDSPSIKTFQFCQKIIDLEGIIEGPLPLELLKKILRKIPLNVLDQKDLDQWINKIESKNLGARTVHKFLRALVFIYTKKNTDPKTRQTILNNLELFLEDKGCKVFQKKDLKHLKWRQELEKGNKFSLNHSDIILGKEIFPKKTGSDQTRAYTIIDQKNSIALIAQNCIALPLRDLRMRQECQVEIEPVQMQDISPDGRIAVVERLNALNTIPWKSSQGQIDKEDEILLNILGKLIQRFIKNNMTPSNFSPTSLMFNDQFQLKLLKPLRKRLFDFNALENFFFECANGNHTIFKELMTQSGLIEHATAKFYRDIVSNTLNEENMDIEDLAGIYKITDPKVIDTATHLTNQILSIKNQLQLNLRETFPQLSPLELNKKINHKILQSYLGYQSAGFLWPSFPDNP